jgi:hypothetical protein
MFGSHRNLTVRRGLLLAGCFAVLSGCGETNTTTAAAQAPDSTTTGSGSSGTGSTGSGTTTNTTPPATAMAAAPTGLTANSGDATVALRWTASSAAASYNVKRAISSGGPYTQVGNPASASYTDTSLADGTTYFYVVSAVNSAGESANSSPVSALPVSLTAGASSTCGMQLGSSTVIFCDTFDAPAGIGNGNRAGDLNGNVWGVSRALGAGVNFGQQQYGMWNSTLIEKCDGTTARVMAPNDIIICNGQLREGANDNNSGAFDAGDVLSLAMYPKQPFDFAGRTGTVSFDVSNDTAGSHAAWPEFWLSDLPVPDPFNHFESWQSTPANGLGIRFHAQSPIGQYGICPNGNNLDKLRWTVGSAVVVRSFVLDDTDGFGQRSALTVTPLDCVIEASGPGQMNHVELRISQNQIDIYATDAGVAATLKTLKHIAVISNANLTLTRGLIWLEDAHYNADKGDPARPSQREHTFAWDNVAFDGPFTYRDFSYDAPDAATPAVNGAINLGKMSQANQASSWNVPNLPANPKGSAARVLFNLQSDQNTIPSVLNVTVNGHAHSTPWPFPDQIHGWRTYAVTVPITDLVAGTNTVQLGADAQMVYSNVNIVLVDVPGGVPALPGAVDTYPTN